MTAIVLQFAPAMASWMVIAAVSSTSLALVALGVHRLARGAVPSRVVWGTALLLSAALTFTQPLRRAQHSPLPMRSVVSASTESTVAAVEPTKFERVTGAISSVKNVASSRVRALSIGVAAATRSAPLAAQYALMLLWPLATLTFVVLGAWSYRRQHQTLRQARTQKVAGHDVQVTDAFGPAVFGALHPRIVVPRWLLDRPAEEQRLVLLHEQSHIAAHDPLLLLTACATAAAMPWNPATWYMLSRLRLAIELDCDARVLREGATPRHYGALLIDLSAAPSPLPLLTGTPAFSHRASHLERRLRTMTDRPTSHRSARRFLAGSLATLAFVAACGAELPTSAELEGMDVAAAEKRAVAANPSLAAASYLVDGRAVSEAEAKAVTPERIASIEISKVDKKRSEIRVTTRKAASTTAKAADSTASPRRVLVAVRADGTGDSSRTLLLGDTSRLLRKGTYDVLVIVDGVKATEDAMKMPPERIERMEVIKGAAAEKIYGPEGAKGVIVITTKK